MFLSDGQVMPANVDTLGDSTPIFADAAYYGNNSLPLAGGWAEYSAIYKGQLWVGVVVRKRAYATARMPFEILENTPGIKRKENGPLAELMEAPNPRMSGFKLWQWTQATRDVYGEAFWLKLRDQRGRVRELHPVHPRNMIAKRNIDGALEYIYSTGAANWSNLPTIPERDVVAFTNYNPDNLERGTSNLESLRMTLLNEDATRRATASFWTKGARPSMILTHPKELSTAAQERLKRRAEANMGGADNMGGVTVFEEGIQATLAQLSNEDMQYIESRKLNREEVCAAFDMSPIVVHILDHATFSNVTEQLRSQYRDTMAPVLIDNESVIKHQLIPDFYPAGDYVGKFNLDDVLRGDYDARASTALSLRNAGIYTGNEARAIVGADASDDPKMDAMFANAALQPLGAAAAAAAAAGGPGVDTNGKPLPTPLQLTAGSDHGGKNFPIRKELGAVMGALPLAILKAQGDKKRIRAALVDAHTKALQKYTAALHKDVMANLPAVGAKAAPAPLFSRQVWDANLQQVLLALAKATAKATGDATAAALGGTFDQNRVENWLAANADIGAANINDATADTLAEMMGYDFADQDAQIAEFDAAFEEGGGIFARCSEIADSRVTSVGEFASLDSAKQNDAATKTWTVNSANPRPTHAVMDGETVPVDELFSNGMQYPGDWAGGADEVAGCECTVDYSNEDGGGE